MVPPVLIQEVDEVRAIALLQRLLAGCAYTSAWSPYNKNTDSNVRTRKRCFIEKDFGLSRISDRFAYFNKRFKNNR